MPQFLITNEKIREALPSRGHKISQDIETADRAFNTHMNLPEKDSDKTSVAYKQWELKTKELENNRYCVKMAGISARIGWEEISDGVLERVIKLRLNDLQAEARCKLDLSALGPLNKEQLTNLFQAYSLSIGNEGLNGETLKAKVKELLVGSQSCAYHHRFPSQDAA